jgi:hypothetical protein
VRESEWVVTARAPASGAPNRRPAGMCRGPGHVVVYGNPAFVTAFGAESVGVPVREVLVDLPSGAFTLLDAVLARGKPLARWIRFRGEDWRMTVVPRVDFATGEVYGVSFHMRARSDTSEAGQDSPFELGDERRV